LQQCPTKRAKRLGPQKDLKDKSFGYWTVLKHEKGNYWLCRCVCGVEKPVRGHSLLSNNSKSCGCKLFEIMSGTITKSDNLRARRAIYNNYVGAARRRGHEFEITFEEFSVLLSSKCHYCGQEPSTLWPDHYAKRAPAYYQPKVFLYNGVDRVDNFIGYTKDNCVPACKICNRSKNETPVNEWLAWAKRLYEFQNLRSEAHAVSIF
jgi:hypothetical protein